MILYAENIWSLTSEGASVLFLRQQFAATGRRMESVGGARIAFAELQLAERRGGGRCSGEEEQ